MASSSLTSPLTKFVIFWIPSLSNLFIPWTNVVRLLLTVVNVESLTWSATLEATWTLTLEATSWLIEFAIGVNFSLAT